MTARWMDSCAAYANIADVETAGYTNPVTGPVYTTTGGRWGTGAIRLGSSSSLDIPFAGAGASQWIFGFVLQTHTLSTNSFWRMYEGATLHLDLRLNVSNVITFTRNGTLLATGTTVITTDTDYLIAGRVKISDTAGELELWVNGVQESLTYVSGTSTTQDTRNAGTAGLVDTFRMATVHNSGANTTDFSEIYIFDTAGSVNNALVADWRIYARRVTANGTTNNYTPSASTNASNVDETQGNDGDTTYNSSATPGDIDLFQFGAVPWTSGTIAAIMHRIVARKDDAGARTIRPKQRQSSTNYSGTTQTLTTAYAHYREIVETNPDTSAAYTTAEMRATSPEFGYEEVA